MLHFCDGWNIECSLISGIMENEKKSWIVENFEGLFVVGTAVVLVVIPLYIVICLPVK